jgi:hypothetical protein
MKLRCLVNSYWASRDCSVYIFRVKQTNVLEVLGAQDVSTKIIQNASNYYQLMQHNIPGNTELSKYSIPSVIRSTERETPWYE